jgi:hypothetical protein
MESLRKKNPRATYYESKGEDYSDEGHEQVQYGHFERGKEGCGMRLAVEGRVLL